MAETEAQKKARLAKEKAAKDNPNKASQDEEVLNSIAPFLASLMATDKEGPTSTTSTGTTSSVTKLTPATAKALMESAADDAGYVGKFSKDDIAKFMASFEAKQNEQIERVKTTTRQKIVPGATTEAARQVMEDTARQEFPSFFKPAEFAKDFIWSRINFKDETTLGAKSLDAIAQVRGILDKFQLLGISDTEAKAEAKLIAMGKKTIEDYTVELQRLAKIEYPQFADRFAKDPTLTTYDIASPIIKMLAKTWDMDPKEIRMDDPIVLKYTRAAGPDGKGQQPSYYELMVEAKKNPKYELTQQANEDARDAATGLARALGFGV